MNEKTKLILAQQQIESLLSLLQTNPYAQMIESHLIQVQVELNRQLTNLTYSTKYQCLKVE